MSAVLCAYETAPGKACGLPDLRPMTDGYTMRHALWVKPSHPFIPGQTCQTCGGSGIIRGDCECGHCVSPVMGCTDEECRRCIGGVEKAEE